MKSNLSNEELLAILDSFEEGILVVDDTNHISLFNSKFTEMWGIPTAIAEQANDNTLIQYALEQLVEPEYFLHKVKFLYGSTLFDKDELKLKDGKIFERNSFPIVRGNQIPGRIWKFREITEEISKSNEIKHYRDHLQELVDQRTQDLKEANDKLTVFNNIISDKLQLPIRSIDVYSAILNTNYRDSMDEKNKNCVDRILESCQEMQTIIEGLIHKPSEKHIETMSE